MEHTEEPAESAGQSLPASGFVIGSVPAGVHTLDLDFAADNANDTASIKRARISLESF